jgi:predicted cupin superfamily sugar epimerase
LSSLTAARVVELLGLAPLPVEGGLYRETWRSPAGSAIYYLLTAEPGSFSALHRLPTDEVYHFYLGDPVEMLMLHPEGRSENVVLGHSIESGARVQHVVPRGVWQGSRVRRGGRFALLGTTMAPGFAPSDYEPGVREALAAAYPTCAAAIAELTR